MRFKHEHWTARLEVFLLTPEGTYEAQITDSGVQRTGEGATPREAIIDALNDGHNRFANNFDVEELAALGQALGDLAQQPGHLIRTADRLYAEAQTAYEAANAA